MDELRRHQGLFQRPDALSQPPHQRQVVADAAQQCHRGMSVRVDETGGEGVVGQTNRLGRPVAAGGFVARQDGNDPAAFDRHGVLFEHEAARNHRDDPAAVEQGVDVDHRGGRGVRAITSHPPCQRPKGGAGVRGNEGSG
jgi:hypothetical protein